MTPASEILLDLAADHDLESWLVLGGEAALAVGLAEDHPDATVHWRPVDFREWRAVPDPPPNLHIGGPDEAGPVAADGVVIATAPDRALVRRWLLMALAAGKRGGIVLLAGANDEGIRSSIADAQDLIGDPLKTGYRARQRFAVFRTESPFASPPRWAADAGVAPGTWRLLRLDMAGQSLDLVTQAGVFSGDRIDAGTQMFLDVLPNYAAGRMLDVGCGAGVIGIAAAVLGAEAVDMTDVNLLAVAAAQRNIAELGIANGRAFPSDVFGEVGHAEYDLIVSNPPFHRGKAVDYTVADRLIAEAPQHLAPGGSLLIVANAFLDYGKRMRRIFGTVETVAATRQYHVLRASDSM